MQREFRKAKKALVISLCGAWLGSSGVVASATDLPFFKGKRIVALVQGEPIGLEEFDLERRGLGRKGPVDGKGDGKAAQELLRRMINSRLIVQEARRMGLGELPELKREVETFSKMALREVLIERQLRIVKPDAREVERRYREKIRTWSVKSVLFQKEEDARRMEEGLAHGKAFETLVRQFTESKTARGRPEGESLKHQQLLPEVASVVSKMKVGAVSPMVKVKDGYVFLKLEGVRYPEDPEAKEQARKEALLEKQRQWMTSYEDTLRRTHAKIDTALLKSLDFEAPKPGFDGLLKDQRVLAEIRGEKPLTVADLAEDLKHRFYHGVQRAIETKRLNQEKEKAFEEILRKRLLRKEALRLGLDKTEDYRKKVAQHEHSLLFGAFVQKVIVPDIKLREDDIKAYYENHSKEFTDPEMMKLWGLVFRKREDAEKALTLLRQGAAFPWAKSNLDGQLEKGSKDVLDFDGRPLTTRELPSGVKEALSGARAGDFRFYESPEKRYYVLWVEEVFPSRLQPYAEVKERIAKKIFDERLKEALEDYAAKLWAASDVHVYLKE